MIWIVLNAWSRRTISVAEDEGNELSLILRQLADQDAQLRQALLQRAERLRAFPSATDAGVGAAKTEPESLPTPPVDESRLRTQIERLLTDLETCRAAGLPLSAIQIEQAATLIRLYSALRATNPESWLQREHAKRTADILRNQRLVGSAFLPERSKRLPKTPTPTELLAQASPEPLTMFDLIVAFQEIYRKTIAERKTRSSEWQDLL